MDKKRIENYKKLAGEAEKIIYDETVKLFEFEQILAEKRHVHQNMSFIKRFFDKETKSDIASINDYINVSNTTIGETKKSLKNKQQELIKKCIVDYINADQIRVAEYNRLSNQFKLKKAIFDVVDKTEESGRSAVDWLFSTIKDLNDILSSESLTSRYDHIYLPEITNKLSRAIGYIECFKRNVKYGSIQIKTFNEIEDITIWENASKVLKDDKSQSIVIKDSRRQLNAIMGDINTTLAIVRVAHNIMNDERNRLVTSYNLANESFHTFWNDIEATVKEKLEDYDIKV